MIRLFALGLTGVLLLALTAGVDRRVGVVERVTANENRQPVGTLKAGMLTVRLEARVGEWHPDGDDAPGANVPAFAEPGKPPQIPGPLVRVVAGTRVTATVRNVLPNDTLLVHGLYTRDADGRADAPMRRRPWVGSCSAFTYRPDRGSPPRRTAPRQVGIAFDSWWRSVRTPPPARGYGSR